MKWRSVEKLFERIKKQLGNPNIQLVKPSDFEKLFETKVGSKWGKAGFHKGKPIITVRYRKFSLGIVKGIIYHEMAHILFPSKPHWWIECYAYKMSDGMASLYYARKYGHTPKELPSKKKLIELSIRASKRLNEKICV